MAQWSDQAIILSARAHGESSAIVQVLTANHGRHGGLVRGGNGRAKKGLLQSGNIADATWRGRLPEHLGQFTFEAYRSHAAQILNDRLRLLALNSLCALLESVLPEREPHPGLFSGTEAVLMTLSRDDHESEEPGPFWLAAYILWEIGLLAEIGFGLDLHQCALTGEKTDLKWVSPRTGRAVTDAAAEPYRSKLLPLPAFLTSEPEANLDYGQCLDGLRLTRHFLSAAYGGGEHVPAARDRFIDGIARFNTRSCGIREG